MSVSSVIFDGTNYERAQAGKPLLQPASDMAAQAAALRAKELAERQEHTRPNGQPFYSALTEFDVNFRAAGENIYWGSGSYDSPDQAVYWWMHSEGHKANILGDQFEYLAVGYHQADGIGYFVQLFYSI